jgi:hypothetical protein
MEATVARGKRDFRDKRERGMRVGWDNRDFRDKSVKDKRDGRDSREAVAGICQG